MLAISRATAADAVEQLGLSEERVAVVGAGVSERFYVPEDRTVVLETLRERLPWLEAGYVLYTGGIEPRKNIDRLLEAYAGLPASVRSRHQLVVVCRVLPSERDVIDSQLRRLGVRGQVRFPGFVPDDDLVRLYPGGGALRVPRALRRLRVADRRGDGVRRAGHRRPQLVLDRARPRRGGPLRSARHRFDPRGASSARSRTMLYAGRCGRGSSARPTRGEAWLLAPPRSTRSCVSNGRRPTRRRARVAVISPLPPQRSGIAKYTYEMLEGLSQHCDIDAFVETDPREVSAPVVVSIDHIARFETKERVRAGYDSVVFCLGNSEFHAEALSLLRKRRGGVVLAHDIRLTGLYAWTAAFVRSCSRSASSIRSARCTEVGSRRRLGSPAGSTGTKPIDSGSTWRAKRSGSQTAISSTPPMRPRSRGSMRRQ